MRTIRPAIQAETVADWNGLPHGRITERQGTAHVFTAGLGELETWYLALGGRITHQPAGQGVTLWTLTTNTDHGNGVPVLVHALALETDQIDADCADAITHTPAA
ncbi:hypothetical protein [Streptomyces mexicanus]|uniref:hypothetical protein n=1 Tax=Streptomyces mexicanus TaxID=178566 RepID=UPI00364E37C1